MCLKLCRLPFSSFDVVWFLFYLFVVVVVGIRYMIILRFLFFLCCLLLFSFYFGVLMFFSRGVEKPKNQRVYFYIKITLKTFFFFQFFPLKFTCCFYYCQGFSKDLQLTLFHNISSFVCFFYNISTQIVLHIPKNSRLNLYFF